MVLDVSSDRVASLHLNSQVSYGECSKGKRKVCPRTGREGLRGGGGIAPRFL